MNQNYQPKIGDRATIGHNCIDNPYTVVEIKSEKRIIVRRDKAVFEEVTGPCWGRIKAVNIEENPNGRLLECRKNKNGYWLVWGQPDEWVNFGEWSASRWFD